MKTLLVLVFLVVSLPVGFAQTTGPAGTRKPSPSPAAQQTAGCPNCPAATASSAAVIQADAKPIPGTNETMLVGRIENLIPIGVLTVLGCEKCAAEAVNWALQQGSSFDDIERALRTVAAMQKLECFKDRFGPEVAARIEKPITAAKEALAQARTRAAK